MPGCGCYYSAIFYFFLLALARKPGTKRDLRSSRPGAPPAKTRSEILPPPLFESSVLSTFSVTTTQNALLSATRFKLKRRNHPPIFSTPHLQPSSFLPLNHFPCRQQWPHHRPHRWNLACRWTLPLTLRLPLTSSLLASLEATAVRRQIPRFLRRRFLLRVIAPLGSEQPGPPKIRCLRPPAVSTPPKIPQVEKLPPTSTHRLWRDVCRSNQSTDVCPYCWPA